ncbi:MAG: autoinducer synthase [Rhodobacteraceae bacterium]|nr:autoinducer synthase [Paracoccaceae bacterium]
MIKYIYADALDAFPTLRKGMFKDRAVQFKERLGWDVSVDADGYETDEYDAINPLYVIYELADGTHGGSMRILPTTGQTMINDHFRDLTGGVMISSPLIWECTRFCVSPNAGDEAKMVAASLMLAGVELGIQFGLDSSIGVFDARMVHIYRRVGWAPEILGTSGTGKSAISAGLWPIDFDAKMEICAKIGFDPSVPEKWFNDSFPVTLNEGVLVA